MKIFYASAKGTSDKSIEELAVKVIPAILTELGHEVQIFIYDPGQPTNNGSFDEAAEGIISADIFIGEMSRASQTLGFQLSYALNNTKPSLYLYNTATKAKPGKVLTDNPSRLLKIKSYDNASLKHALEGFISYATEQLSSVRTSFMSTKQIDRYISKRAQLLGLSKGEVIRQLLSKAAEK